MKADSSKTKKVKRKPASSDVRESVSDLAADASNESEMGGFMDPAVKRKSKRGRPTNEELAAREAEKIKSQPDPQVEIDKIKPLMRPLWETVSHVGVKLAETRDAAIGPSELSILVDTSAACVHQYLPDMLGTHANLIILSITFGQWATRVWMLRQMQLEKLRSELGRTVAEAA